jgi:hypothetical protein
MMALKRKSDEILTQDMCKRFRTVLSTDDDAIIANYISLIEKVNKLEDTINKIRKYC